MFLSFTSTAPTWRRRQVARFLTRCAISMKYSSHEGRSCLGIDLVHGKHGVLGAELLRALLDGREPGGIMPVSKSLADKIADYLHLRLLHAARRDQRRA